MNTYDKAFLLKLKAKIKSQTFERREIKKQIKKLGRKNSRMFFSITPDNVDEMNDRMERNNIISSFVRYHGSYDARIHHVAYGLLRGVPYRKMERDKVHTKHSRKELAEDIFDVLRRYAGFKARREWTIEKIIEWLE